ncbi:MAG: hypothetical protein C0600_03495 [Ignavibacteria bacterium]|nr:MAG: hypothetical protein C0600_03495 [Ignavibacteria bacterium]
MKTTLAVLTFFLATLTLSAQVGEKAPAFSLKDKDGNTVTLASLEGKVVVLNFWATWCPPCRAEIPDFKKVYQNYREKGVEIIGVSLDQKGWSAVRPFLKKWDINYPVVLGDAKIARAYGNIRSIPTTFIIDREGTITDSHVGAMSEDMLIKTFKKLL